MKLVFCFALFSSFLLSKESNLISIKQLLHENTSITYQKIYEPTPLTFAPFPLANWPHAMPHEISLEEAFILTVPQGSVYSHHGFIISENKIVDDLFWPLRSVRSQANYIQNKLPTLSSPKKFSGRVAVITTTCKRDKDACYFHWISTILGRLALLDLSNTQYDWLYVSDNQQFMKETLLICGVDEHKIINPHKYPYIIADEIIVPSIACPQPMRLYPNASYCAPWTIEYLQSKAQPYMISDDTHAKKVFISRTDATARNTTNEDDVFSILEPYGFKRYCLSSLSFSEQITLFYNAKIIIATHGAGLVNSMFSKPETKVFELFQNKIKATYWFLNQMLHIDHVCIATAEVTRNASACGKIPLQIIEDLLLQQELYN